MVATFRNVISQFSKVQGMGGKQGMPEACFHAWAYESPSQPTMGSTFPRKEILNCKTGEMKLSKGKQTSTHSFLSLCS